MRTLVPAFSRNIVKVVTGEKQAIERERLLIFFFDQKEDVLEHLALIQKEMDEDTMPPAGGLTDQEYEAFVEWLGCVEQQ